MGRTSEYYTLNGYRSKNKNMLTESMEDYLEMIYRYSKKNVPIHVKDIAIKLNVQPSSVSKMAMRLKNLNLINFQKYGLITITKEGKKIGSYLLWRHNILVKFFKKINKKNYSLEQVEKIEHFIDFVTLKNLEQLLKTLE